MLTLWLSFVRSLYAYLAVASASRLKLLAEYVLPSLGDRKIYVHQDLLDALLGLQSEQIYTIRPSQLCDLEAAVLHYDG
jgi:hypothetical protein